MMGGDSKVTGAWGSNKAGVVFTKEIGSWVMMQAGNIENRRSAAMSLKNRDRVKRRSTTAYLFIRGSG
jgi:hypothetical protein